MAVLLLADSFHVSLTHAEPTVVGLPLHVERFTQGLDELRARGLTIEYEHAKTQDAWIARSLEQIGTYTRDSGPSFPRLECVATAAGAKCRLVLRPAPPLRHTIALTTQPASTPVNAHLKGPNIEAYAKLMKRAGGEVLFTATHPTNNRERSIVEGTTTTLMWWEGDTLTRVPAWCDAQRVASVTEQLIVQRAAAANIAVARAPRTPTELQGFEVWAVNALHGIRPVTHIDGVALPAPNRDRLDDVSTQLMELSVTLPTAR